MNDGPTLRPQQAREHPDPVEQAHPVPWPLLALVVLLVAWGVVYIANAGIDTPSSWGDGRVAAELAGRPAAEGAGRVDGAALYASLCAACHQANGQGVPGVFPPLAGSEWVLGKDSTAAALLLHGVRGPLTVKGVRYDGVMPAFGSQLDDAQIAAVLSHVRHAWGNSAAPVEPNTVTLTRAAHGGRTQPFAGEKELPHHD